MRALLAILLLLLPALAAAEPVTIAWDPNPPAEQVTGYIVFSGPQSRKAPGFLGYARQVDVGNVTQATLSLTGPSWLAVVAYNAYGLRSDYSVEVFAPGGGPIVLLTPPQTAGKGLCARLAATRADGTPAQVEACTNAAGVTTWTVLP